MNDAGHSPQGRRRFLHQAGVALAGAGLAGVDLRAQAQRHPPPADTQHLTVALCARAAMVHLPLTLAQALGFFDAEGVSVRWLDVATDEAALQAVQRGVAHVAACAYPLTIAQHARGTAWRSLVLQTRTPQVVLGVSANLGSGFKKTTDWRGKRVGLLYPGACDMVLETVLQRARLHPGQVTWVHSDDAQSLVSRFRSGQLDALCAGDARVWALEQQGQLRVVADTRSQRGTSAVFGGVLPGSAVCAPEAWAVSHPGLAQKLADAVVHALKWLHTAGPADLLRAVPSEHLDVGRAQYLSAVDQARDGFSPDGLLTPEAASTALKVLGRMDHHVRTAWIDLERTYTNEFTLRAKTRFRV
jgi:NitT/TauT family transport system substrate-binding protein